MPGTGLSLLPCRLHESLIMGALSSGLCLAGLFVHSNYEFPLSRTRVTYVICWPGLGMGGGGDGVERRGCILQRAWAKTNLEALPRPIFNQNIPSLEILRGIHKLETA